MPVVSATTGRTRCYPRGLAIALSRGQSPARRGAIQNNLATALLQAALSGKQPEREVGKRQAAVAAFRSALDTSAGADTIRVGNHCGEHGEASLDSLGTHFGISTKVPSSSLRLVMCARRSVSIVRALDQLADADLEKTANDLPVALQVLAELLAG